MAQVYEKSAVEILQKCSQVLQKQKSPLLKDVKSSHNAHQSKGQYNPLLLTSVNSGTNPYEESQNDKIIEKLKRKNNKKKELKQVVIRKTDLGENQLIFTKEELQRLKEVDDEEMYGIKSTKPIQRPNLFQSNVPTTEPPNKKYFGNPVFENPQEEIKNYMEWVDLNEVKNSKKDKKSKIINFQKRQKSSSSNNISNLNNRLKVPLPVLMPKHSSPFRGLKNLQLGKAKSCYPLIKKNSVDTGFLNSINPNDPFEDRKISDRQKLSMILSQANQKIQKEYNSLGSSKQYIYMTEQRKQALFQCQILRKVKRQIGPKFYNNLQLTYGNKQKPHKNEEDEGESNKENDQKLNFSNKSSCPDGLNYKKNMNSNSSANGKEKGFIPFKEKNGLQNQAAEKMIQKNRNRLRQQRKRVIQKIVC